MHCVMLALPLLMTQLESKSSSPEMATLLRSNFDTANNDAEFYGPANTSTPDASVNLRKKVNALKILPRNSVDPTVLQTSSSADIYFDIPPNSSIDYINNMYFKCTLANADGTNTMNLVDVFDFFDWISISCNGEEVQSLYPVSMRNDYILSNTIDKLYSALSYVGISTTDYSANLTVANSGTTTVYMPIKCLISTAEFPIWRSDLQWRLQFRTKGGAQLIRSGSAVVTSLTIQSGSVELDLDGEQLLPEVKDVHNTILNNGLNKTYRYLDQTRLQLSASSVTSAVASQVPYTDSGFLSHGYLVLQTSGATGTQLYDSVTLTSFDVMSSQRPVLHTFGDNQYFTSFAAAQAKNFWSNTNPILQRPLYYFTASTDPVAAIKSGANFGSYTVTGTNETIRFIAGSSVSTAVMSVYSEWYSHIVVDYITGKMRIFRKTS